MRADQSAVDGRDKSAPTGELDDFVVENTQEISTRIGKRRQTIDFSRFLLYAYESIWN